MSATATAALHIDWTRCRGRGACTELLAGLDRDEWGYPLVAGGGSDLPIRRQDEDAARDAVALCPLLALSIRPGGPGPSNPRGGRA